MAEMRLFAEIIFWTAVVAIAYTYAGYPLLLMLLSKLRGKPVQRREVTPPVTVIVRLSVPITSSSPSMLLSWKPPAKTPDSKPIQ